MGVEQWGCVSKSLYIYNPTKNTIQISTSIDISDQRVEDHYYTIVYGPKYWYMAQLVYVRYYTVVYGPNIWYMGTKKPHVVGVWLELFPMWK